MSSTRRWPTSSSRRSRCSRSCPRPTGPSWPDCCGGCWPRSRGARRVATRTAEVVTRSLLRLLELQPVPDGVGGVEAAHARDVLVPRHRRPRLLDGAREGVDVIDRDAGVGLAGRDEALLDADVDLGGAGPEPRTAAGPEPLGLVDLGHPEDADVEVAHGGFAPGRAGHLDVVQEHLHAPKVS